ncbi:Uncharacterised protein [Pseudomonas aeruginosa]|nr:Uncharacterised protein [Pseudomonas aeruginosa]
MSRPVILTAKLAGCYSVRSMELTCSLSMQRFPRHGTNGFATCSRECHSATKPLHWLDGRRAREPSAIWANGTPIRKTTPTRLASIDRNGTVCRPSVGISDQRSLSLLAEMLCILSWCQAQAKDQYSPLWNSGTQTSVVAACRDRARGQRSRWASGSFNRCRQAHHRPQSHARKISTLVSRHLRRLRSFAPTSNHPPGFW